MALKLQITDARGVITRWHKITGCQVEWPTGRGQTPWVAVTIRSWVNQAQRDQETRDGIDTSVATRGVAIPMPDVITLTGLYTAIKQLPDWVDAEDC